MRLRARVDANQDAIVDALSKHGATVQRISAMGNGCPDLLVGFRGLNHLLECKDGNRKPSARRLTDQEAEWHGWWRGQVVVVESPEEALRAIGL